MLDMTDSIVRLMPPPQHPEIVPVALPDRLLLPSDYMHFLSVYGVGSIDLFINLLTPSHNNTHLSVEGSTSRLWEVVHFIEEDQWNDSCINMFIRRIRSAKSVAVWGSTENGDLCLWLESDSEDGERNVLIVDDKFLHYHEYATSITQFLHAVLTGSIMCPVFPADFPGVSNLPIRRTNPEIASLIAGEHAFLTSVEIKKVVSEWDNDLAHVDDTLSTINIATDPTLTEGHQLK